ncbi:MAG: 2-isopropylmalate synthase [Gemmataceae bacterium]
MMSKSDPNRVIVFDTTLRDGEQSPGCSMTPSESSRLPTRFTNSVSTSSKRGFPLPRPAISNRYGPSPAMCTVHAFAAWPVAIPPTLTKRPKPSAKPRKPAFTSSSPRAAIHREFKLKMTPAEVAARAVEGVQRAKDRLSGHADADVEFSPEDAARTELDFLAEVVEKAVEAGATTLNIPDTVGYATPEHYAAVIRHLKTHVRGIDKCVLSVHCHNDLGLAVANSLAALQQGARQIECTMNGIGERAGNTALEEIVMAIHTRKDFYGLTTGINTKLLYPTSRKLIAATGMVVQRNKAIVGRNAFAHEAGIHQDGMLKERSTYEIMKPEDVGIHRTELVLGKHSGRHALRQRIVDLGYHIPDEQLNRVFEQFKALADRKKDIYDADIEALVEQQLQSAEGAMWTLAGFTSTAGTGSQTSACVSLIDRDGHRHRDAAAGNGPIDALFKSIGRVTGFEVKVVDYRVRAVSQDIDALGEATVEVEYLGRRSSARAVSVDVIEASALAYLEVINRLVARENRGRLKPTDAVATDHVPA